MYACLLCIYLNLPVIVRTEAVTSATRRLTGGRLLSSVEGFVFWRSSSSELLLSC